MVVAVSRYDYGDDERRGIVTTVVIVIVVVRKNGTVKNIVT
jgi:hypothetical protein